MQYTLIYKALTFFLCLSLFACSVDEGDEIYNSNVPGAGRATITFEPQSAFWYYRTQPDSLIIELSKGIGPYVITEKPAFSSDAQIKGNKLVIYPKFYGFSSSAQRYGYDFLNIQDNYGNVNTFNIEVGNLTNSYTIVDSLWIQVSGDTTFNGNPTLNIETSSVNSFSYGSWDEFYKRVDLILRFKNNGGNLSFNSSTKQHANSNPPDKVGSFTLEVTLNGNLRTRLIPIDTNQVINYAILEKEQIEGNMNITVEDASGIYQKDFNLQCYFLLKR